MKTDSPQNNPEAQNGTSITQNDVDVNGNTLVCHCNHNCQNGEPCKNMHSNYDVINKDVWNQ